MDRRNKLNTVAFRFPSLNLNGKKVVAEPVVTCPDCGSNDTFINGTRTDVKRRVKLRSRVCRGCGKTFIGVLRL